MLQWREEGTLFDVGILCQQACRFTKSDVYLDQSDFIVWDWSSWLMQKKSQAECLSCNHQIVPRVVFRNGEPSHSICPFCGQMYKDFTPPEEPYEPSKGAFAFGAFLGRLWRMAPIQRGFVEAMTQSGLSDQLAVGVFKIIKLIVVVGLFYCLR